MVKGGGGGGPPPAPTPFSMALLKWNKQLSNK